ncbi:MAG: hypothetical protein MRY83_12140 [Flavobacteriales bacterium]|nr:hypothetical protein [Flavobacteriales bacterium]
MKFKITVLLGVCFCLFSCDEAPKHKEYNADEDEDIVQMEKPCADPWVLHHNIHEDIKDSIINDTVTQVYLEGKLWFEVQNDRAFDSTYRMAHLKYYRTDGSVQEEGPALYTEHPAKEYLDHGIWKYYDCNGTVREELEYSFGKFKED